MSRILISTEHFNLEGEVLAYEGELMEVSITQENNLQVSDFVFCEYLNRQLETRVIQKMSTRLWLFVPFQSMELSSERRSHNRYQVHIPGLLMNESETISVTLVDFTRSGFGLDTETTAINVGEHYYLMVRSELLSIMPKITITHNTHLPNGSRFGSEIITIKSEDYKNLRVFLMYQHLSNQTRFQ